MKTWKPKNAYVCEIRRRIGIEWHGTPSIMTPYSIKTELIGVAIVKKSKFYDSNEKVKRIYTGEVTKVLTWGPLALSRGEVYYTPPVPMSYYLKEDADLDKEYTIKEAGQWEKAFMLHEKPQDIKENDDGKEE